MDKPGGMTFIVKVILSLVIGFMILFGINLVFYGQLTPGGGFPGGVVIAIAFIALVIAFGRQRALKLIPDFTASLLDSIGAFLFLLIGIIGMAAGYFFYNWLWRGVPFNLVSAGTIVLSNLAIALKVGAGLYGIFLALAIYGKREDKEGK